jgi:hypothetical protein
VGNSGIVGHVQASTVEASTVTVLPPLERFGPQTLKLERQGGFGGARGPFMSPVPRQGVQVSLGSAHESVVQLARNLSGHPPAAM